MPERRCPYCNELVPSNSLTCPKCYKKIPVEPEPASKYDQGTRKEPSRDQKKLKRAIALDAVIGLFGLLGIGQLYLGSRRGAAFLLIGLVFFLPAAVLAFIVPFVSTFFAIPLFVIYALLYLAALADLVLGSVVFRFGPGSR